MKTSITVTFLLCLVVFVAALPSTAHAKDVLFSTPPINGEDGPYFGEYLAALGERLAELPLEDAQEILAAEKKIINETYGGYSIWSIKEIVTYWQLLADHDMK